MHELNQAISTYTATAAQKLRAQKSYAQGICVFLQTNRFKAEEKRYFNQDTLYFIQPTDDTRIITEYALALMQKLYKTNYEYSKCGLQLLDLMPNSFVQTELFTDTLHTPNKNLIKVLDEINQKFGKESITFAVNGIQKAWQAKAEYRSPRYTTCWNELAKVY